MKTLEIGNLELRDYNPWWVRPDFIEEDPRVIDLKSQMYAWTPPALHDFPPPADGTITIRGPRQVGKTTLLKLLIKKLLLEMRVEPLSVFFFSCDRISDHNDLFAVIKSYLEHARPRTSQRLYCFLDEISFVKEWQRAVKALADAGMLKNLLLVLTGSNALDIKTFSERLPGRRGEIFHPDWEMLPLDFAAFLKLIAPEIARLTYKEAQLKYWPEIKKLFEDYLLCGGFLSAINKFYKEGFIPPYIYELYWNWIEGDLHRAKKSPDTALAMAEKIYSCMSSTASYYKLARESGMASHVTANEYIDTLKRMYVCLVMDCFIIDQKRHDPKKNKKIYFLDPFILSSMLAENRGFLQDAFGYARKHIFTAEARPKLAEMCVASTLHRRAAKIYYGRGADFEIDFAVMKKGEYQFFEVKYREEFDSGAYRPHIPLFITKESFVENGHIRQLPLELFLGFVDQILL